MCSTIISLFPYHRVQRNSWFNHLNFGTIDFNWDLINKDKSPSPSPSPSPSHKDVDNGVNVTVWDESGEAVLQAFPANFGNKDVVFKDDNLSITFVSRFIAIVMFVVFISFYFLVIRRWCCHRQHQKIKSSVKDD